MKKHRYGKYYEKIQEEKQYFIPVIINTDEPIKFTIDTRKNFLDQFREYLGISTEHELISGWNYDIEQFKNCMIINFSDNLINHIKESN